MPTDGIKTEMQMISTKSLFYVLLSKFTICSYSHIHDQSFDDYNFFNGIDAILLAIADNSAMLPTLRANPYPEVKDLFCRLLLSALLYQLEVVDFGDMLRF
ncbi:hypothetical protein BC833DRAFT_567831 [Globomyces pollinis-pini]|nr:hypothetical protein BC833DRAFT_567831 [Globomyces pollinis-pini]